MSRELCLTSEGPRPAAGDSLCVAPVVLAWLGGVSGKDLVRGEADDGDNGVAGYGGRGAVQGRGGSGARCKGS